MKRWSFGLAMLALGSAGCETYYRSGVAGGLDSDFSGSLARAGWVYAVVGFLVWLVIARWVSRRRILRWFFLPVLLWLGQRVGGGGWWLWVVIVVLVYLLPNRIPLRPAATSASAAADATPWYWRLSSALVWAAIFAALDRAFGEALHAATLREPDWTAPFSVLTMPEAHGAGELFWSFLVLIVFLIIGVVLLVLLLLWYAFGFVLNAIHELRIVPVVGLAVGFGFAPTVELFGRSIDTLLGALGSTLGFFGISTVEVFTKRGFANRLWALLPLVGLAGLVAVIEPVVRPVLPGVVGSLLRSPEAARPRVELVERRTNTSRALRTTLVRVCSGGPGVAATVRWEAIADGDDAVAGLGRGCLLVTENGSVQVASDDGRVPLDRPRTLHRGQSVEATYYFWISPKAGSRCALQIPEWSGGRVVAVPSLTFLFNEEAPGP